MNYSNATVIVVGSPSEIALNQAIQENPEAFAYILMTVIVLVAAIMGGQALYNRIKKQ